MLPSEYAMLYPNSMKDAWIQGTIANNLDKDFVRRISSQNKNVSNSILNPNGSRSNLLMADDGNSVYPTIENRGGVLTPLPKPQRFSINNQSPQESIEFANPNQAAIFGRGEYKRANRQGFEYFR